MKKHFVQIVLTLLFILGVAGCVVPPPTSTPAAEALAETTTLEIRTFTHALGETQITGTPERIVTLEWSYTENLLALGLQPVGVADIAGYNSWVQIPVALDDDVVDVGTRQEPNLETLTALDPDLIIAPSFRVAESYAQLSAIAPTLAFDAYPTDENTTQFAAMQETFMTMAEVLGREAEGEAVLAAMNDYFAAAQAQLDAAGMRGEPFVLAQAFGQDTVSIRLFTDNAMAVEIMEQIGLENSWSDAAFQLYGFTTVGVETLPELGDLNFFYVVQDDNNVFTRDAIQPVWESLAFVQNDNAYPLGGDTWLFGGPLSAEVLVDIVVEALTGEPVAAAALGDDTAFPVTIEHKYGSTTIETKPERIVTVGLTDQDAVLALGVTPVGTTTWIGGYPGNIFPWAQDLVEGDLPEVTGDTSALGFEKIATLKPDLILALYTGITEEEYALLGQIAPTVAPRAGYVDYGLPWQESTRIVGQILGESAQAEALIAGVDEKIAQIRTAHPEFVGATGAVAAMYEGTWVYGPEDGRARLLSMLGFEIPQALLDALPAEDFGGNLSLERADLLDLDLMVWLSFGNDIAERGGPVYQSLPVYTEGHEVFVDELDNGADAALSFVTVLSLPYLLDEFVPLAAEAVAGTK